jgi:hypothetical protein
MEIYKTMIRPVVTYSSQTWTLKAKDEKKTTYAFLKDQILKKICGPVNIDNVWRIRNNVEINNIIEDADILRHKE